VTQQIGPSYNTDGWIRLPLAEVVTKVPLSGKKLKQSDYLEEGKLPVIDQGHAFIGGYTDREDMKALCKLPVIVFGDHTKAVKYVDFDFVAGADGVRVIEPSDLFSPKLLYYFLHVVPLPDKGYARHFQYLEKSLVSIPPLPEQHRIVAKIEELFTRLDAGVEALNKVKAQLKRYRQAVLKHAFEGKLTEEWREKHKHELEPASVLLERIREERKKKLGSKYKEPPPVETTGLPELPDGWERASVSQLLSEELCNGRSVKSLVGGFPVLRLTALKDTRIDQTEFKEGDWSESEAEPYLIEDGDFLVVRGNGSLHLVGRGGLVGEVEQKVAFPDTLIRVRIPNSLMVLAYVAQVWDSMIVRGQLEHMAKTTAGIYKVNQKDIEGTVMPIPSQAEQNEIVREIDRRMSIASTIGKVVEQSLKQAERLRQSILKRAFEGKLVPQDPNDEPAEKLLERIRAERAKKAAPARVARGKQAKQMRLV